MQRPEYMKIYSRYFLNDVATKYNINEKIHKDAAMSIVRSSAKCTA